MRYSFTFIYIGIYTDSIIMLIVGALKITPIESVLFRANTRLIKSIIEG